MKEDIPIFVNLDNTRRSLAVLENMSGVELFCPAWDQEYSFEMMRKKVAEARELISNLERTVCDVDPEIELSTLVNEVCDRLHKPMWKTNPLFTSTIACCRMMKSD